MYKTLLCFCFVKNRMHCSQWLQFLVSVLMLLIVNGFQVPITYVQDAVAKGGGKCVFNSLLLNKLILTDAVTYVVTEVVFTPSS